MPEVSEQDVQNLAVQHREYQKQAEAVQKQMNMLQMSRDDCTRALEVIEGLDAVGDNADTMLPIGAGSFVYARLTNIDKVVVNVGAGISVEKSLDGAKETLTHRRDEIGKVLEHMNGSLAQIVQGIQSIEATVAKLNAPE